VAEVNDDGPSSINGNDLGDPALASPGKAGDVKTAKTKHSAKPLETAPAEHSLKKPRRAFTKKQPYENKDNVVQLSAQRAVVYEKSTWKRSQKKPGYLIRRMEGYSIAETEYGVSYLWVLSRFIYSDRAGNRHRRGSPTRQTG
jgi:hypothetical protein